MVGKCRPNIEKILLRGLSHKNKPASPGSETRVAARTTSSVYVKLKIFTSDIKNIFAPFPGIAARLRYWLGHTLNRRHTASRLTLNPADIIALAYWTDTKSSCGLCPMRDRLLRRTLGIHRCCWPPCYRVCLHSFPQQKESFRATAPSETRHNKIKGSICIKFSLPP